MDGKGCESAIYGRKESGGDLNRRNRTSTGTVGAYQDAEFGLEWFCCMVMVCDELMRGEDLAVFLMRLNVWSWKIGLAVKII